MSFGSYPWRKAGVQVELTGHREFLRWVVYHLTRIRERVFVGSFPQQRLSQASDDEEPVTVEEPRWGWWKSRVGCDRNNHKVWRVTNKSKSERRGSRRTVHHKLLSSVLHDSPSSAQILEGQSCLKDDPPVDALDFRYRCHQDVAPRDALGDAALHDLHRGDFLHRQAQ